MKTIALAAIVLFLCHPGRVTAEAIAHRVEPGDTLWSIAEMHYGNRHYSRVLVAYHDLDASKLQVGQTVALPSILEILTGLGVQRIAPDAATSLARAAELYRGVAPRLAKFRKTAIARDGVRRERIELPAEIVTQLESVAADLSRAASSFESVAPVEAIPAKIVGQLRRGAAIAEELSTGSYDQYGYDIDMVDQRIAYAAVYLVDWAQGRRDPS